MSLGRDKRLARLERRRGRKTKTIMIWYNAAKETAAEALARQYPEGVPRNAKLLYISWLLPDVTAESATGVQPAARPQPGSE